MKKNQTLRTAINFISQVFAMKNVYQTENEFWYTQYLLVSGLVDKTTDPVWKKIHTARMQQAVRKFW